jgi:group I intron endonuclease
MSEVTVRVYACGGCDPPRLYHRTTFSTSRRLDSVTGTYVIEHTPTGGFYIGSSQDIYVRVRQHLRALRLKEHKNPRFQVLFSNANDFLVTYTVMETTEDALRLEQLLIEECKNNPGLINIAVDVYAAFNGRKHKEETKTLIRQQHAEQFSDPKKKEIHRQAVIKKWQDPEYRRKQLGRKCSTETIEKHRLNSRRLWKDPSVASRMGRPKRPVTINGVTYESRLEAAEGLNVHISTIDRLIKFNRLERYVKYGQYGK